MGLTGSVFNNCKALCLDCGKHDVDRSAYGNGIHINSRADKHIGRNIYHSVVD